MDIDPVAALEKLTPNSILDCIEKLRGQERALRVLLRAVCARERASGSDRHQRPTEEARHAG
jgi:hypothetical protein